MIKLNAVLAGILIVCALALVTSQHKARKLFVELQRQQDQARQLEVEYGQLQLEQSTWAMHSRIEKIAANDLKMRVPLAARVHLVPPPPAPARP
jgi:cell division protein FtsL